MKKLPNIFKPGIDHNLKNNENVYYSFIKNDKSERHDVVPKKSIKKTISLKNRYEGNVIIKTINNEYKTRIVDKMGNNIITKDGKVISLNEIIDIYEQ